MENKIESDCNSDKNVANRGYRRLFIIRKDLHLTAGKLSAMIGHCCEAYWTNFLKNGSVEDLEYVCLPTETKDNPNYWMMYRHPKVYEAAKIAHEKGEKTFKYVSENSEKKYLLKQKIDKDIWDIYVNGIFTKTICEAKNLENLRKAEEAAKEIGLVEGIDYGYINDKCLTELEPENEDGTCTVGIWFRPLPYETSYSISKKFKLYRD